jgi:hypothetical protein
LYASHGIAATAKAMPPAIRMGGAVSSSTNHLTDSVKATTSQITRLTAPKMN